MKRRPFVPFLSLAATLLLSLAAHRPVAAQSSYAFVDLGVVGTHAGNITGANAINNAGQITGSAQTSYNVPRAFRITPLDTDGDGLPDTWNQDSNGDSRNDLMVLLPLARNTTISLGAGINASGQVGGRLRGSSTINATLWSASGALMTFTSPSYAEAINDVGDLAGHYDKNATSAACLWRLTNGKYTQVTIPSLPGYPVGFALGVNSNRQVVGQMNPAAGGSPMAFLWSPSVGTLALAPPSGYGGAIAQAINNQGVVVGRGLTGGGEPRPVVWQGGSGVDILEGNPAYLTGGLYGLNNANTFQAVGWATRADGTTTAILWNGSAVVDLASCIYAGLPAGASDLSARGVNDTGYIVGSYRMGPDTRAFLLIPTL